MGHPVEDPRRWIIQMLSVFTVTCKGLFFLAERQEVLSTRKILTPCNLLSWEDPSTTDKPDKKMAAGRSVGNHGNKGFFFSPLFLKTKFTKNNGPLPEALFFKRWRSSDSQLVSKAPWFNSLSSVIPRLVLFFSFFGSIDPPTLAKF